MTTLRETIKEQALDVFRHAIRGADPTTTVARALSDMEREIRPHRRVVVISFGKAAVPMAEAARDAVGDRIVGGVAVTKYGHGGDLGNIPVIQAGHPIPDESGVRGARKILEAVSRMGPDDLVLVLVSGGGSALLSLPADGISLSDLIEVNRLLIDSSADIGEINTVRKHLSAISGGGSPPSRGPPASSRLFSPTSSGTTWLPSPPGPPRPIPRPSATRPEC